MADGQLAVRNVGAVPHLLRQETVLARKHFHCPGELASHVRTASRELVVASLARQERPATSDSSAVERSAIGMFPVSVPLISMPDGASRRLHFERRVDHLHGVQDARVVRSAESEAHQRQCIEADHQRRWSGRLVRRPVLDRDKSEARR